MLTMHFAIEKISIESFLFEMFFLMNLTKQVINC